MSQFKNAVAITLGSLLSAFLSVGSARGQGACPEINFSTGAWCNKNKCSSHKGWICYTDSCGNCTSYDRGFPPGS